MYDLVIVNAQIVTENEVFTGCVCVKDEKIVKLIRGHEALKATKLIDAEGDFLLPGGIDAHVHIRYPDGKNREDFYTGTCAAVAGGTTTIIEHPISSPPQYNVDILDNRRQFVDKDAVADVAFLGAAGAKNINDIMLLKQAGVVGFKTFLHQAPEGREKEFYGLTSESNAELLDVMMAIKRTGLMLSAHTEDNSIVQHGIKKMRIKPVVNNLDHARSREIIAEVLSVNNLLVMGKMLDTKVYLVHISSPQALELARKAKATGQSVYVETCPQYLFLDERFLERYGPLAKCNPPLRKEAFVQDMWPYLLDGTIDVVASDHAPYRIDEKLKSEGDIFSVPAGFPGLESRIPLMLLAYRDKKISMIDLARLIATNPAEIFALGGKGKIAEGYDADFTIIETKGQYKFDHKNLKTKAREVCSFLDGMQLGGKIKSTILRGELVYDNGEILVEAGYGKNIK